MLLVSAELASGNVAVRDGDAYWEISTRHLPQCSANCNFELAVQQNLGCSWQASDSEELLRAVAESPNRVIVYVHGNWMNACDARRRAAIVYSAIANCATEPICFIAISWPSEQRERAARDVIHKKPLIDATSFYLANFLERLPPGKRIGILGYSFGGAVVSGALQLLAGGQLSQYSLGHVSHCSGCIRMSLIAPAFDRGDFSRCGKYAEALLAVERVINLYNSRDPILRRFRFFDRGTSPVAAGFAGLTTSTASTPLDAHEKISQFDCSCIGKTHDELAYYNCTGIRHAIDNLFSH